jgi:hypothetical protein
MTLLSPRMGQAVAPYPLSGEGNGRLEDKEIVTMKTLMTASAIVALVAATPALAQSEPLVGEPPAAAEPMPGAVAPEPTGPEAGGVTDAVKTPDPSAAPAETFIAQQAPEDTLASAMIGTSVENGADETLGNINDLVLSEDGSIDAVVIGVGGFLGIGEKNVAVAFDAIEKTSDSDGNVVLVLDASAEELEAAPPYVTVAELKQQQEMQQPAAADPMAPAPVPTQ